MVSKAGHYDEDTNAAALSQGRLAPFDSGFSGLAGVSRSNRMVAAAPEAPHAARPGLRLGSTRHSGSCGPYAYYGIAGNVCGGQQEPRAVERYWHSNLGSGVVKGISRVRSATGARYKGRYSDRSGDSPLGRCSRGAVLGIKLGRASGGKSARYMP